jgi:hypothetical protein
MHGFGLPLELAEQSSKKHPEGLLAAAEQKAKERSDSQGDKRGLVGVFVDSFVRHAALCRAFS